MNITQQDIIDTLKHGHIPINELIEYAKTKNFDLTGFEYDDIDENYHYGHVFDLLWSEDGYYIDCYINPPDMEFEGTDKVTVQFNFMLHITNEEYRRFPQIQDHSASYTINSREDFINALDEWKMFVYVASGIILAHRKEILEDVDKIVKSEKEFKTEHDGKVYHPMKSTKKDYITWMNKVPNNISNVINDVIEFKKIEVPEEDYEPIYLSDGVWYNPLTKQFTSD